MLLIAFASAMIWVGTWIGMKARSADAVQGIVFVVIFPLTFVSNAFVPVQSMPDALQWVASWNPISAHRGGRAGAVRQPDHAGHEGGLADDAPGRRGLDLHDPDPGDRGPGGDPAPPGTHDRLTAADRIGPHRAGRLDGNVSPSMRSEESCPKSSKEISRGRCSGARISTAHASVTSTSPTSTITHAWFVGVNIDALIDRVVINGVDVTSYVNERDPWYPLRAMLRPSTPDGMRAAWSALEDEWAITVGLAKALPESALEESVNGEWSFVQTLRHLVFAMDKWFTVPILGEPFDPMGLPNSGSVDFPWPGLDRTLTPSLAEVMAVRADRAGRFRGYLDAVTAEDFDRTVDVLENGPHPLRECLHTVFEEEFWHNRYARRDLEAPPSRPLRPSPVLVIAGVGKRSRRSRRSAVARSAHTFRNLRNGCHPVPARSGVT